MRVYLVHFGEPVNGETDHFFGSLTAIYSVFTPAQIGCQVENLWHKKVASGSVYTWPGKDGLHPSVVIRSGELIQQKTKRGGFRHKTI